jgi:hypothetical protein
MLLYVLILPEYYQAKSVVAMYRYSDNLAVAIAPGNPSYFLLNGSMIHTYRKETQNASVHRDDEHLVSMGSR